MRTIAAFTIFWIPMIPIAVCNGLIRIFLIAPRTDELTAHQLSTITGLILFSIYTFFLITRHVPSKRQAILGGLVWMILTVIFEFAFGHYVAKHSWGTLLHDYNFLEGRIWVLIPLSLAILPWLMRKILIK